MRAVGYVPPPPPKQKKTLQGGAEVSVGTTTAPALVKATISGAGVHSHSNAKGAKGLCRVPAGVKGEDGQRGRGSTLPFPAARRPSFLIFLLTRCLSEQGRRLQVVIPLSRKAARHCRSARAAKEGRLEPVVVSTRRQGPSVVSRTPPPPQIYHALGFSRNIADALIASTCAAGVLPAGQEKELVVADVNDDGVAGKEEGAQKRAAEESPQVTPVKAPDPTRAERVRVPTEKAKAAKAMRLL